MDLIGNGECNFENQNGECNFDGGDCCDQSLVGNMDCDAINSFNSCGQYDGGDCCSNPYLIGCRICS